MIVVTGAAGLIGAAVVRELNRRGYEEILLVDHMGTSDKWKNLRSLKYREYFEKGDFLQRLDSPSALPSSMDAIIHLGACSATTERDASYLMENNYRYSIRLAEYAARHSIRMVYASSAATYGDGEKGFDDDISNMDTLEPMNGYGFSKQMFDQWLKRRGFAPLFAGLKYFNVFGPNEYHKGDMMSLVLKAFRQIQTEKKIRLFKSYKPEYKDGEQMRDFFYVKDAAQMTVHFALDNREAAGVFNAGSGEANTWLELASSIFEAMGETMEVEFIDMPESIRDRYQYYTCAPIDRVRQAGYTAPVTPLREAVKDYVRNYLMQNERWA